jgi:Tol biopolymer transport system component
LGDTADNGQYIETVAKRGYRFTAAVTPAQVPSSGSSAADGEAPATGVVTTGAAVQMPVERPASSPSFRAAAWFAAGLACAGGVALLAIPRRALPAPPIIRAQIAPGVQLAEASTFAVSPDGQQLVFAGAGPDGVTRLWIRRMDADSVRPLPGTEVALAGLIPPMFWSPDGQSVAFASGGRLMRIEIQGGAPQTVCDLPNGAIGGSWNADDLIVVGQPVGGLLRCPAAGGAVSEVTRVDATKGRVTSEAHLENSPVWSADGKRLIFTTSGGIGSLFEQPTDGTSSPKPLLKTNEHLIPTSVSADGRYLLYATANAGKARLDLWVLSLTDSQQRFPLIQREFDQSQGQFSPDTRLVAYVSDESGRSEVLLRRFAVPSDGSTSEPETVIVSSAGGTAPRWGAGGHELYFISPDGTVMVAAVNAGARISVGEPRALFRIPRSHGDWAAVSDGSRFLIAMPVGPDTSAPFTILWNRLAGLRTQPR